jgi:hypothetical protein
MFRPLTKGISKWGPSCQEAVRLVSDAMDRPLSFKERMGLRLHLLICILCLRYDRQLQFIRTMMRAYPRQPDFENPPIDAGLSREARARLNQALGQ